MSENPSITPDQVRHVARLSRLELSETELEQYTGELEQVLAYVDKLGQLGIDGVEPLTTALDTANALREDQPAEGLSNEQALENAPEQAPPYFKVPKVLGE
jgi:aspartyl-tRNA(Asn)/glutamyl-tRNA(Gln) amidotransferase subunit C